MSGELVVLVHGLYMRGPIMRPLAKRLEASGFRTLEIDYPSLGRTPIENAEALRDRLLPLAAERLHFVGHSLGGIVVLHLLARWAACPPGRVVLIGSPVRGSQFARAIHARRLLRPLLGRSIEAGLLGGAPLATTRRAIGVITGTRRLGLGAFVHARDEAVDGAVAERETLLDGSETRLVLPHSHTGLLLSRRCGDACARFLRTGRFDARLALESTSDTHGERPTTRRTMDNPGERHGRT